MAKVVKKFKGKPGMGYFVKGKGVNKTLYEMKMSPRKRKSRKKGRR
jgi:hypothetical protein